MNVPIKIFCEGITDQFFIADFITITTGIKFSKEPKGKSRNNKFSVKSENQIEIIDVGGCTKLASLTYSQMLQDNTRIGGINLVIFDADFNHLPNGNKGFKNCQRKLEALKKEKSLNFDYYIWPNHKDDGEVENLLIHTISTSNTEILNCIHAHCDCLGEIEGKNLNIPDLKAKINFLVHTLHSSSKLNERDYTNGSIWNINITQNDSLGLLYSFLNKHLKHDST